MASDATSSVTTSPGSRAIRNRFSWLAPTAVKGGLVLSPQIWHVRRLVLLVGFLVLAAFPAAASADGPDGEDAVPFDGYRHPVSSWPNATHDEMFSFTIYAEFEDGDFQIEVATEPDLDPDGTLADANRVDAYVAPLDSRVTGEVFTAPTSLDAQWLGTLGTYYWQAHGTDWGTFYATPVQSIPITERPPAAQTPPPPRPPPAPPPPAPPLERTLPTEQPSTTGPAGTQVVASTAKP